MAGEEKRRSERVIPFVSEDEVVVIHQDGGPNLLSKMMDLSDVGTLVYMLTDDGPGDGAVTLSIHHQKNVVEVPAVIVRKNGRLIAFNFVNPPSAVLHEIQSKLIRMEVEWMRLSRMG